MWASYQETVVCKTPCGSDDTPALSHPLCHFLFLHPPRPNRGRARRCQPAVATPAPVGSMAPTNCSFLLSKPIDCVLSFGAICTDACQRILEAASLWLLLISWCSLLFSSRVLCVFIRVAMCPIRSGNILRFTSSVERKLGL